MHVRISVGTKFRLKVTILNFWTKFPRKRYFHSKTKKMKQHHWILHIWISLAIKFQLQLTILTFWTKFAQKGHFQSKTEGFNITFEFFMLELESVPNLSLKWEFWCFGPSLPQKGISTQKEKNEHDHWISHVQIKVGTKFQLKVTILNFWTKIGQKEYFHSKTKKNEQHHWILHIWISLATKFQLRLIILISRTKFTQKGYFQSKTERMNNTIEFCMLELEKVPHFSLQWQFWLFGPNVPW